MTASSCPVPFSGETIFSLLARIYLRSAYQGASSIAKKLDVVGCRALASPLGGGFLAQIFQAFPETNAVLDMKTAIERHTILPLFQAFAENINIGEKWMLMADTAGKRGGWDVAPRISTPMCPEGLRFCTECCAQDVREVGVPYWHREHQPRFVTRCWRHDIRLKEIRRSVGVGYKLDVPPIGDCGEDVPEVSIPDPVRAELGMRVATVAAMVLDAQEWTQPKHIRQMFVDAARKLDLLHHGRPSRKKIWDFMECAYGKEFLAGMALPTQYTHGVVKRFTAPFKEGKVKLDAAVVILMAMALGIENAQLCCASPQLDLSREARSDGTSDSTMDSGKQCDSDLERVLAENEYVLGRAALALGIHRTKLIQRIISAGITCPIVQGHAAKYSEAEIREMIEMVRKGMPREQIVYKFECVSSFLDQIPIYDASLRRDAKQARHEDAKRQNREAVTSFIKTTSSVTRALLYEALPGPMSFLARHDKTWLRAVMDEMPRQIGATQAPNAGRGRVDDEEFDRSVLAKLESAKNLAPKLEPPRRMTPTLALRLSGVPLTIFARMGAGRMPRTEVFLGEFAESEEDYTHRKLRYALGKLAASRNTVTATALRLASGFTPQKLRQHRDLVHQLMAETGIPFNSRTAGWLA